MDTSKISILLIAPYQSMADSVVEACRDFPRISLETFIGNLDDGINYVTESVSLRHYDLILSRGGTATALRNAASIPVVDIEVSAYDMLRSILAAKQYGREFVVIGFSNITAQAHLLAETTGWNLKIFEINDREDARRVVTSLYEEDPRTLIVGDVISISTAESLGMNNILITSGRESISKALKEAETLFYNTALDREKSLFYRTILDHATESVAVYDEDGQLVYTNLARTGQLSLGLLERLAPQLQRLRQEGSLLVNLQEEDALITVRGFCTETTPPMYIFWLSPRDTSLATSTNAIVLSEDLSRTQTSLTDSSEYLLPLSQQMSRLFPNQELLPGDCVHISSPSAAASASAAAHIHLHYKPKSHTLITVRCGLLTPSVWQSFLDKLPSAGPPSHTIYFENLDLLPTELQDVVAFAAGKLESRYVFLSSSSRDLHALVQSGLFSKQLYGRLCSRKVRIPSLSERRSDIPVFAHFLIQQYNKKYSKQIIGLQEDTLQQLQAYDWPLDVEQFEQVMQHLLQSSSGHYVSSEDLNRLLVAMDPPASASAPFSISLEGTLAEMELELIHYVVEQENLNYTKAAKRLGISRSTLWRKLSERQVEH